MNKAILMGRLTRDPEVRYSQNNNLAVCNYTLAIDRRFARQGEEKQTDFIPIVTFGKTAEFCEKYFRKGQQVAVSGRIQTRTWDDNDGKKHYMTEVIAEDCYFADSKRPEGGGDYGARPEDYGYYPQVSSNAPPQSAGGYGNNGGVGGVGGAGSAGSGYGASATSDGLTSSSGQTSGESSMNDGFVPMENENDLPF